MEILIWLAALIGSLTLLVFSADYFTKAAERIGLFFGLSSFIVGATIVSVGSSMPELATSIIGVLNGVHDFPISNAIGSNIANCLLVGGICAIIVKTLKVEQKLVDVDLPFFFLSSALFILLVLDKEISRADATIMLLLLIVFMVYTVMETGKNKIVTFVEEKMKKRPKLKLLDAVYLIGGTIGIYFSADFTIRSVTELATILNISSSIVAMLAVAVGTSLPELVVSVRAAIAGKHSIAMGNIFGSNTFNILAVTGIPAFFGKVVISDEAWLIGIPFLIVTTLAFIFVTTDDRIQKWEGMALLVLYVAFVGTLTGLI
ncbi:calcium/sodium antiporter [bacterium]|nr:calcium/sodium antiporter [bacterium]NCQ55665.1 calcium/sodium antiporter [Candidatus Parcubacteria bacterium]NCS67490.1 calcium/sodium antiporter [Candidatus Peregrinibacteria bacterium]NCS96216.1 calcium/sodium antiporter [bacterium]